MASSDNSTTLPIRKVFIPYINGRVYDMWGCEPSTIRVFSSREEAERFSFTDIREVYLEGL